MNTPDTTQWCDYARGLVEPRAAERMRAELARSESARRAMRCFGRLAQLARHDKALQIPEHALRVAKAAGSLRRHDAERLTRQPFTVLFDNLCDAMVGAGTRDLQPSFQQTVFRSSDYTVEVRLEQGTNPRGQVVVGQLLQHQGEARPVAQVPVLVLSDGHVVGRDLTSRFGEFQAAGLPAEPLKLCLLVGQESCIDVPLGNSNC